MPQSSWNEYDLEIVDDLYSLWSNIHPAASVFDEKFRGRQYFAVCLCAGAMASLYRLDYWNSQLMDYIVVEGDRWFGRCMADVDEPEYEVKLEDFCSINSDKRIELPPFMVNARSEMIIVGRLYGGSNEATLSAALSLFFASDLYEPEEDDEDKQKRLEQEEQQQKDEQGTANEREQQETENATKENPAEKDDKDGGKKKSKKSKKGTVAEEEKQEAVEVAEVEVKPPRKQIRRTFGVLQCWRKVIGFGRTNAEDGSGEKYFMFDCQSMGAPVFWPKQGGAYVLLCKTLQRLLHCIVVTLAVPCYNVKFALHEVKYRVGEMKPPVPMEPEEDVVLLPKNPLETEPIQSNL